MLKHGSVTFKKLKRSLFFSWADNGAGTERIDLYDNVDTYRVADTTTCVAAYFRKTKELFFGESELIQQFLMAKSSVFMQAGKQQISLKTGEDGVYFTQTKVNEQSGLYYEITMLDAKMYREKYETKEILIDIQEIDNTVGLALAPINLSMYEATVLSKSWHDESTSAEYYPLEVLKQMYPLEHIEEQDYVVVTSYEQAVERLQRFKESKSKFRGIDTETTGTHIGVFGDDILTGVVLSYDVGESTYYPFRQDKCEYNLPREFLSVILKTVQELPEDVSVIGFNGKFDKQAFLKERPAYLKTSKYIGKYEKDLDAIQELETYEMRMDIDAYILSVLVDPRQVRHLHTLKGRTTEATKKFWLELEHIFKQKSAIQFNILPPDIIRYYACPDAPNTIRVYLYLIEKLPADERPLLELESKLVDVKACNEFYGLRLDMELLNAKLENEAYKVKMLGDMFRKLHNTNKNINSSDVRRDILYNQLRCPVVVRTDKNLPATSKVAISYILEKGTLRDYDKSKIPPSIKDLEGNTVISGEELISNRYPSLVILQKYALATKEQGAYRRLWEHSEGGRMKFYINQVGAGSGRQTSDAHQFSDGMKQLVLADSSHHVLWSADYKQMELRILAYKAKQTDLIKLESDPNVDVHRAVLSLISKKPMWAITDEERKMGKAVNFGVVYLMSEYGLVKRRYGPKYTEEELIECRNAITDFYNTFQGIKAFIEHNKAFLKENGYIMTDMKRRRYFPQLLDPDLPARQAASLVRAGNNTPVQGFGADLLKVVEVNLQNYIKERGWDELVDCDGVLLPKVRLMLSIHDEVLVSSHESIPIEDIIEMFKVCMEIEVEGAPPFYSAPAMINNWYDGKNSAYEIDIPIRDEIIARWRKDKTSIIHKDTYVEDLNKFRQERLNTFMKDLIRKYKTVDAVAEHAHHDEFTHTLIEIYVPKSEKKKLTHEERIHRAVECYMNGTEPEQETALEEAEDVQEEVLLEDTLKDYVHVDQNGELITEKIEDVFEEEDGEEYVVSKEKSAGKYEGSVCRIQYTLSDALIDVTDFRDLVEAEVVNERVAELHDESKSYRVLYLFRDRVIKSDLRIDYADRLEIAEVIEKALKGVSKSEAG